MRYFRAPSIQSPPHSSNCTWLKSLKTAQTARQLNCSVCYLTSEERSHPLPGMLTLNPNSHNSTFHYRRAPHCLQNVIAECYAACLIHECFHLSIVGLVDVLLEQKKVKFKCNYLGLRDDQTCFVDVAALNKCVFGSINSY